MKIHEIMNEAFDKSYPWSPSSKGSNKELYYIDLPNGHEIAVNMVLERGKDKPIVEFTSTDFDPDDIFKMTNTFAKSGITPVRVFTALVEILKQSVLIKRCGGFIMDALKEEPSRVSLYGKLLKRFGYQYRTYDNEINARSISFEVLTEQRFKYSGKTGKMEVDSTDPDQRHGVFINGKLVLTFNSREEAESAVLRDRRLTNGVIQKLSM